MLEIIEPGNATSIRVFSYDYDAKTATPKVVVKSGLCFTSTGSSRYQEDIGRRNWEEYGTLTENNISWVKDAWNKIDTVDIASEYCEKMRQQSEFRTVITDPRLRVLLRDRFDARQHVPRWNDPTNQLIVGRLNMRETFGFLDPVVDIGCIADLTNHLESATDLPNVACQRVHRRGTTSTLASIGRGKTSARNASAKCCTAPNLSLYQMPL